MMHISSNSYGTCVRGQIEHITLPMLFALLEKAKVTGRLRLESGSTQCELGWEVGSIVGLQWDNQPLQIPEQSERTIVSVLVKQSGAVFSLSEGSYTFESLASSPLSMLPSGRLPLAFFIRYGLASTSYSYLVEQIFTSAFATNAHVKIDPTCKLKTLGSKAEEQLHPYKEGALLQTEPSDSMQQLFVALWCVSLLELQPSTPTHKQFTKLNQFFSSSKVHRTTPKEIATPFGPAISLPSEDLITEMEYVEDSYTGLLSPSNGGLSALKIPEQDVYLSSELQEQASSPHAIVHLFKNMHSWEASDLFLSQGKPPAIRKNGQVISLSLPPTDLIQLDTFLDGCLSETARHRFQEQGDIDVGYSLDPEHRFRLNLHKQKGLLALVARAIPTGDLSFTDLGLPDSLKVLASQPRGLILVTGATGSGKSTTLASMLNYINQTRQAHIVTIEEPIEFVHKDALSRITQREVGSDTQSFHSALRHVVRESPDVILIGEMRDMETMQVALSAALTGHLVLASLHTVDAVQTLQRIMSYFPDHLRDQIAMDLALSLQGIVSQRLLPTIQGDRRVAAIELLTCTPAVSQLLRQQRIDELSDQLKLSTDPHTQSFTRSLLSLYRKGIISYEMGRAYATNPEEFSLSAQGMETGVASFNRSEDEGAATGLDIKSLLYIALERQASDLHLTTGRPPILRINGKLKPLPYEPLTEGDMRLLLFSILSVRQRTTYQLEKEIDFALSLDNGQRFRINAYYQKGKMAAALRAIPSEIPDPDALFIPEQVMQVADHPHGLMLVVGPTGSGKSTTLACMIDRINRSRACRIITIEDPIEFTHTSQKSTIDQREVHADTKSFGGALKFILRQDPDVILIGEMRDIETISAAITAAETGHLVLATLHTNNAVQTINRIVDVFPAHQQPQIRSQLAAALVGVVSQRLLPKNEENGRIAAFEIMLANPAIRNLIREDKMHQAQSVMESSRSMGMVTLDYALQALYHQGLISLESASSYINNPQLLTDPSAPRVGGHTGSKSNPSRGGYYR